MSQLPHHAEFVRSSLNRVLVDWRASEQRVRFPVVFAVERESTRIWSLRTVPVFVTQLAVALSMPASDRLLLLSGGGIAAVYARRTRLGMPLVPATLLPRLQAPVELIHVRRGCASRIKARDLPTSVLSDPDRAVPVAWGSRFALSIQDGCHGVIYSPERDLLRRCLRSYLVHYQQSVLARDAVLPPLPDRLLEPLLDPLPPGTYVEVTFEPGSRFWTMDLSLLEAGSERPLDQSCRWVCEGEGGSWRAGWSW